MTQPHILYGSYASYYTAKTRAYLRKKGIEFVERLPSDPLFRGKVRPASGSHRIPQLLTPTGDVIQDSVEIQDTLEAQFPALPAIPATPRQRIFVHLMELLASEGLVKLAWLHRWVFEDNLYFVKMDFGRSFRPQGNDEELLKYGNLIAEQMMRSGIPESTPELRERLEQQYIALLKLFEVHLIDHPYFLGGHPSAADYAIMGALHAHLGRDPVGLHTMQLHAPRVFRWVEHMIVPEVQSPEFFDRPIEYLADDEVPQSALDVLAYIATEFGEQFLLGAKAFNQAMAQLAPPAGYVLNAEVDQPLLAPEQVVHETKTHEVKANLYAVWLTQRAQNYYQTLATADQSSIQQMLAPGLCADLVALAPSKRIARSANRLVIE